MEAIGWALDAPCRAYEAVGRVQRQLERLMRQPGVILRGGVRFRFKWADLRLSGLNWG